MKHLWKYSVRRRSMIAAMVCWVAMVWLLTGVYSRIVESHYIDSTAVRTKLEGRLLDSYLSRQLVPLQLIPDLMARIPALIQPLKAISVRRQHDAVWLPKNIQDLFHNLSDFLRDSEIQNVMVLDIHDRCIGQIGFTAETKAYCSAHDRKVLKPPSVPAGDIWFRAWGDPGLYHSAPIRIKGKIYGTLIGKINIDDFFQLLEDKHAFVADGNGVIILARSPSLLMQALPGATVQHLPEAQRMHAYGQKTFVTVNARMLKKLSHGKLIRWHGRPFFSILETYPIGSSRFTLYVSRDLDNLPMYQMWRYVSFFLLSLLGLLIIWQSYSWWRGYRRVRRNYREMRRQHKKLKAQAYTDALTGATNRRHFFSYAEQVRSQAIYRDRQFCLMYIDFDDFKNINDSYGHDGGDEALRQVATLIRKSLRSGDILSRLGGDEFAVLLPGMTYDTAMLVGKRICHQVSGSPIRFQNTDIRVTLSIGVTDWHMEALEEFSDSCRRADQALYAAKEAGRNQVRGIRAGTSALQG